MQKPCSHRLQQIIYSHYYLSLNPLYSATRASVMNNVFKSSFLFSWYKVPHRPCAIFVPFPEEAGHRSNVAEYS